MTKKQKVKFIGRHLLTARFYRFVAEALNDIVYALYTIANLDVEKSFTMTSYYKFVEHVDEDIKQLSNPPMTLFSGGKDDRDSR